MAEAVATKSIFLRLRPGAQVILLYTLFAYAVPALLIQAFGLPPGLYREAPINYAAALVLILAFLSYLALGNHCLSAAAPKRRYEFRFFATSIQLVILLALLFVAPVRDLQCYS